MPVQRAVSILHQGKEETLYLLPCPTTHQQPHNVPIIFLPRLFLITLILVVRLLTTPFVSVVAGSILTKVGCFFRQEVHTLMALLTLKVMAKSALWLVGVAC